MSTLKVDNVLDQAGTALPSNLLPVTASAWVNFNGTGVVAIRGSYNVTSITDNGTGSYDVNLTSALDNTDCSVVGSCVGAAGGTNRSIAGVATSTSVVEVSTWADTSGALLDVEFCNIAVFGGV